MNVEKTLNQFSSISLSEMEEVSLMKRTDTKFVIPKSKLGDILNNVSDRYRVLEINGNRVMSYQSLYFDTKSNQFYKDHHNKRSNRTKVRIRNYVESDLYFLEIKQKNNKGVTTKSRVRVNDFEVKLSKESKDFINSTVSKNYNLTASLWNGFNRVTLVNLQNKERITIDFGLNYILDDSKKEFENLVIIEVKQERYNRNTPIVAKLKKLQSYPYSISKYCIGMLSLNQRLKHNQFKRKIQTIERLTQI